ncbi:hypothetical protein JHK87_016507 [Glycine soja]|nr:hypothetical protein JHK87_016507 [Glycine soja]
MGGGGAMRSAAKIAGIGVSKAALRPSALPTEQTVRNASRPTAVTGVSSQSAKSAEVLPTEQTVRNASRPTAVSGVSSQSAKSAEVAPLHTAAAWDDWDFAEDGELVVPRMVFGSVPTLDEAKEATAELKDAIDQVYLCPESSQYSSPGGQVSALSPTLYGPVNRSCVIDAISDPTAPKHAIQAFHLLSTSREAQAVVASLACDPNVWNAVMENSAVSSFFQSQQSVAGFGAAENSEEVDKLSSCASETVESPGKLEGSAESHPGNMFDDFMGLLQNVKLTVIELVSRLSGFLQNIFPTPDAMREKMSFDADGNTKASFMDSKISMGGTFIGLAVLVIMVIVTKRA